MDKYAKMELEKMFSLMERMENHYTLSESLEKEERVEHKRDTYTDMRQRKSIQQIQIPLRLMTLRLR